MTTKENPPRPLPIGLRVSGGLIGAWLAVVALALVYTSPHVVSSTHSAYDAVKEWVIFVAFLVFLPTVLLLSYLARRLPKKAEKAEKAEK